jgi:hypothetical protein
VGHELSVPEPRRLPRPAPGRRRPRAAAHAARRRADLQRLPPPAGGDPARPRQHPVRPGVGRQHRVPAAPLDLQRRRQRQQGRHAAGRAALRAGPVPEPEQLEAAGVERPAVRDNGRDVARRAGQAWARAPTSTSPAWCSTASSCTSATTTGRPSSRSTSRTTTSARSTRAWAASSPATTCAGSSRTTTRCRPWAWPTAGQGRQPGVRALAQRAAAYRGGEPPKYGAIWLTYYPHIMVEWYPHVLTVSTLHPVSPQKTLNVVEFFYPEEIARSSASSSRRSRPPTWRPASRTTRSPCAWTPAARP